jgi:lipopolysaccharide export LptBFGC system permease protein LptF
MHYVLYMLMRTVASGGYCAPALAVFVPNVVGLFGGMYLIKRAA